ncbi:ABC transporter ATP-binding protein [Paenibacillus sp. PL2-23]|uniref:staphylopine uptake ABC transporter ATP-binding protein CntD n=1 Tax=Paenibacillus sp. PL2-23 TaxID=2100729 RepID=UPI0030FAE89A
MNTLEVEGLHVWDEATGLSIVRDSSFRLRQGQCLAIVGESGSGKSMTCKAIMRLNQGSIRQSGRILLSGEDIGALSQREMRKRRGKQIGMIVQNGMAAFDPSRPVGVHLRETLRTHFDWSRSEAESAMCAAMESVMLHKPVEVMNKYPHQLSGGMLQRVMIALALALKPDVIIADEPTTALDAISQYEVVEQLVRLREQVGCSLLFISHDLGVVKRIADDVVVMKDGAIVEQGSVESVFTACRHPYTQYLLDSRLMLSQHFQSVMGGVLHA